MLFFESIACNNSGTHFLQSMIESVNLEMEKELLKKCVSGCILPLSYVLHINKGFKWNTCNSKINWLNPRREERRDK